MVALAAAELADGELARAETLIRELLADQRVAEIDRARVNGLLGDVFDAGGRYSEALDAYRTCNESLRQIHFGFSGGTRLITYAEQLTATVASHIDQFHGVPSAGADVSEHVFLIGFPRSGTTLLEVVLDGHPRVASLDEHELFTESVRQLMRNPL